MPTNPNVPQDVQKLASDLANKWSWHSTTVTDLLANAIMADRASRPSLSTDGDGVVPEAMIEAAAEDARHERIDWQSTSTAEARAKLTALLRAALSRTPKAELSEEAFDKAAFLASDDSLPSRFEAPAPQAQSEPSPLAWTSRANLRALDGERDIYPAVMRKDCTAEMNVPLYASPQPQPVAIKHLIGAMQVCADVARTSPDDFTYLNGPAREMLHKAVAALRTALATPPAQGDMVLVPREPTDAMIEAGIEALREHTQLVAIDRDPLFVWRYMLHAATPSEER